MAQGHGPGTAQPARGHRAPGARVRNEEAQVCCLFSLQIMKHQGHPREHDPGQLPKSAGILYCLLIKREANYKRKSWDEKG